MWLAVKAISDLNACVFIAIERSLYALLCNLPQRFAFLGFCVLFLMLRISEGISPRLPFACVVVTYLSHFVFWLTF